MRLYVVTDLGSWERWLLTLDETASLVQLDPQTITSDIEETGKCATDTHEVTEAAAAFADCQGS